MNRVLLPRKVRTKDRSVEVAERRVWVRYSCDLTVSCRTDDDDFRSPRRRALARASYRDLSRRFAAKVSNISRGGMRVESTCPFEKGSTFNIELDRGSRMRPRVLSATVKQISQINSGVWSIGCCFSEPLDQDDLNALLLFGPASNRLDLSIFSRAFRSVAGWFGR